MIQLVNFLFEVINNVFQTIIDSILDFTTNAIPSRRNQQYNADFGKVNEILQKNGQGFCIGTWSNSLEESHSHMIALGGSGSKK